MDCLYGQGDDDTIEGGSENDHIEGGAGNDIITGNEGADTMYGNGGGDCICDDDAGDLYYGYNRAGTTEYANNTIWHDSSGGTPNPASRMEVYFRYAFAYCGHSSWESAWLADRACTLTSEPACCP